MADAVEVASMVEKRRGVVINISSTPAISGYIKGALTSGYAANLGITKHGAAEFAQSME